jgi:transcriptional regulator with XRE-family HTH domain
MEKQNLTFRQLESMTGVSHSQLARIANGESSPTADVICKILKATNSKFEELVQCNNE